MPGKRESCVPYTKAINPRFCTGLLPDFVFLNQAFFMFLGLYTLYGGILLPYENIPAGFRWVYYTNPGRWLLVDGLLSTTRSTITHAVLGYVHASDALQFTKSLDPRTWSTLPF